ncbi:hypothetical protein ACFQI7_31090 [Paenibacillus allorhizosphaerae]|uniref:DUF418 domain-containing protein n=1 Tax=Paenibacillus allorhizosphaerae TaxID=2849866 RepID=A0ABN7TRL8_9BACL|nr:hypothetical protein [Paenibacillus allorhizosphaerae]CAG7652970.1 hypothetical protein PAECIP111802_05366 [Paenibacillus allorhizosphaerae]
MWYWMKKGWAIAWQQPFAVFALFLYNLAWGVLIYKLIQSIVVPLLHRYPGKDLSHETAQLFWIEGQFQIMKTDLLMPYIWWASALIGLRMLLSPVINAGIYYSLHHLEMNAGYRFVKGIRKLALPFLGLYALQTLLSLVPLYWLVPYALRQYAEQSSYTDLGKALLPATGCFIAYIFLLQLLFLYLQVGKVDGRSSLYTVLFVMRQGHVIVLTALGVLAITFIVSAAVMVSAFVWAGLAALVLFQAYRLVHMFMKLWAIATQYALWSEKA